MDLEEIHVLTTAQKAALVAVLALFDLIVLWFDPATGSALSLQPLYVVPVVVAGVPLGNVSLAFLCLLSTVLRVGVYRRSAFTGADFTNFQISPRRSFSCSSSTNLSSFRGIIVNPLAPIR